MPHHATPRPGYQQIIIILLNTQKNKKNYCQILSNLQKWNDASNVVFSHCCDIFLFLSVDLDRSSLFVSVLPLRYSPAGLSINFVSKLKTGRKGPVIDVHTGLTCKIFRRLESPISNHPQTWLHLFVEFARSPDTEGCNQWDL